MGSIRDDGYLVCRGGNTNAVSPLGRPWQLRDVDDVEDFARGVRQRELRKLGAELRPHVRDDALAYLLTGAWQADTSYDERRYPSFHGFLHWKLTVAVTDWHRAEYGRTSSGCFSTDLLPIWRHPS